MGMQTAEFKAQGLDGRIHRLVEFTEYLESISTNKKRQSSNIKVVSVGGGASDLWS